MARLPIAELLQVRVLDDLAAREQLHLLLRVHVVLVVIFADLVRRDDSALH